MHAINNFPHTSASIHVAAGAADNGERFPGVNDDDELDDMLLLLLLLLLPFESLVLVLCGQFS